MEAVDLARRIVDRALDKVNANLPADQQVDKGPSTVLVGEGGSLDSVAFVDLTMQIQELIFQELGVAVTVVDETFLTDTAANPFRTVDSAVQHVARLIQQ